VRRNCGTSGRATRPAPRPRSWPRAAQPLKGALAIG
jgi:hypothetical protein